MERELLRLSETPLHLEKTWESGGVPVLTAEVTLPCCGGKSRRARRFDRYYRQYARAYLKYCEAELLPRATETMRTALERSAPWSCARAALAYRVTLVRGDILSLYTEGREEHLPPRLTLRRAETWDRRTGFLLPLTAFFPPIPKNPRDPSLMTVYSMLSLLVPSWMEASVTASATVFASTRIESITL